jgi:SAM-dependent methyltransferase
MIRTGALEESQEEAGRVMTSEMAQAYYIRKAPSRDLFKIRGLRKFHNHIKEDLLLARVLKRGAALFDMTCGRAGDIHKWIAAQPGWVLGTDIAEKNLTDAKDSAYQRYLTQMIQLGGKVPPMLFVQADASQRLSDGGAGQSALDRAMLRTLWGSEEALTPPYAQLFRGKAADGFDVLSCMFSIHYFFKDRPTIDGWLRNISQSLRVGGYFVGCCFDGDAIIGFLQSLPFDGVRRGSEGGGDIWTIQKRYEENSLPPTDEGLGKAIDVSFISIGNTYTEYLVSWPYLQERLGAIGLELLNPEELAELGLQHSTNMFGESYEMSARNGRAFPMTPTIKQFSFLNRWFIFKRRSMGAEIPYTAPGMQAAFVESDAAVDAAAGPIGPTGRAPASEVFADDSTIAQVGPKLVVEEVAIEEEPVVGFTAAAAAAAAAKQAVEEVDVDDIEAAEEDDDEEEEEAEEEAEKPLVKANGPIYKFYQKGELKDDLGLKDKGWRRWLATYAPFPLKDWRDPTVLYPSMEAALAAAKYQIATNKPELGPTLFSMDGAIHQKYAGIRLEKGTLSEKDEYALQEDEGDEVRKAMKPAEIKKAGAKLDEKAWLTGLREVIDAYVRQRFAADARFAKILGAIKEKRAHLMFYTTPKGNEFSGFINDDGDIEGANLYGRALMKVVGLYYPE